MNTEIESAVEQCPQLSLKLNKGERHRIMRNGIRRGSLWVTPRTDSYIVAISGEVKALMYNYICSQFGAETGVDQERLFWKVSDVGDVTKVIHRFGEP